MNKILLHMVKILDHTMTTERQQNDKYYTGNTYQYERFTTCSCGASWSHPNNRTTEEISKICNAHASYGQKMKSTVL